MISYLKEKTRCCYYSKKSTESSKQSQDHVRFTRVIVRGFQQRLSTISSKSTLGSRVTTVSKITTASKTSL